MANYKFPGVYASIRDLSGVVATNSTTACAFVGEAEYGPVNTPVLLSTLQDYTDRFGSLSSKYGYAGYSLAVAADTINEHYFVRVVPMGDPETPVEERVNDAHWAAAFVPVAGNTKELPASKGYFYEEVKAAQTSRDAGAASGLFAKDDVDSAFLVMANDPNNRKFYISLADSTINENRAYSVLAPTRFEHESGDSERTFVTVTVPASVVDDIEEGSAIVVSRMSNNALNGTFKVYDWALDGQTATITYIVNELVDETNDANARVGRYPDNNQTTFTVNVMEKVGRVMQTLETFEYCTLYPSQDNYGNSMFIEDVINGSSNYIQVFVNNNFTDEDPDAVVIPAFVENLPLTGGKSGNWTDMNQKYTDLNAAWENFRDRSQVGVSLLMNSGYVTKENVSYQAKMLEIAEHRRDCFCLFDSPMTETDYEDLIDWRKNIQGFNSYRGAVSAPWVKTYDSVQGRANFVMCPSAYVAKIMGNGQPWVAPAGLNRGVLTSATVSPTGLTQYYDQTKGGNIYADNQVNCIIKDPSSGYVNWGQRTLQAKPSALDRINVARTVIYIETVLRDAAKWHLFENNTAYERMQITLQFTSFLNSILSAEGIQKFQVVCNETNNTPLVIANNQLVVDIYLWPTYTAEVIILNTTVMGADTTVTVTTA